MYIAVCFCKVVQLGSVIRVCCQRLDVDNFCPQRWKNH